jgi:hypothetical protein
MTKVTSQANTDNATDVAPNTESAPVSKSVVKGLPSKPLNKNPFSAGRPGYKAKSGAATSVKKPVRQ